jgi:poly(hydroxyalkanoate) depolymerase family esterase
MDWKHNLNQLLGNATELVRKGQLADATRAIQQALGGAFAGPVAAPTPHSGATLRSTAPQPAPQAPGAPGASRWRTGYASADVEDAVVIDRPGQDQPGAKPTCSEPPASAAPKAPMGRPAELPGSFTRVAFSHPGAPQDHYYLYVPPGATASTPMPLVLMLHGCTQHPQDFATGTGMNAAAAPANALVLYPAQPGSANPKGCWNWFRPTDQQRGAGEPAVLVAMVREVTARHPVDAGRVYVAGLSAGGAMAALLGREYPDVFAAVGVHSGLQAGAAHNVMGALSAMKNGAKPGPAARAGARYSATSALPPRPIIVFHGDADGTVHARNGEQLIDAALASAIGGARNVQQKEQTGRSPGGKSYTRTVYFRAADSASPSAPGKTAVAEHWVLHGGGHAWAGGHAGGSHTDPGGVNATQEMLRFFLEHPHQAGR